jgi:hypothetical protein
MERLRQCTGVTDIFIDIVVVLFYLVYVNYSMKFLFSLLPVKEPSKTPKFVDAMCTNERCLHITWLRHNPLGE